MPYYECIFIARQDISGAQADALADHFTKVIADNGGNVTKREYWGLRNLAYRIRKNRKGHYVLLNIDAPAATVQEAERQMRINEDIIRHLTVRVEQLQEGPSVMMQSRSSRDDRGERGDRGDRDRANAVTVAIVAIVTGRDALIVTGRATMRCARRLASQSDPRSGLPSTNGD